MAITSIAVGHHSEAAKPDALKAALAEFISTLIFVFAGEGSGMAFSMMIKSIKYSKFSDVTMYQNFESHFLD